MSTLPRIAADGRGARIGLIAVLALGQACAAAWAAVAMRAVFAALHAADGAVPWAALGGIAGAGIAITLLKVLERTQAERVGQAYAASVRATLYRHLSRFAAPALAKRRTGALALRFVGDLAAVRGWVSHGIARLISAGIVLPVSTGVLFWLAPGFGLAVAAPLLAGLALMAIAGVGLGPAHDRLRRRRARIAADMSERVAHAPQLHVIGRSGQELARLERNTARLLAAALARMRRSALLRALPDAISGAAAAALLLTALQHGLPAATTAAGLATLALMIQPLRELGMVWDRHRAWQLARRKAERLLATPGLKRRAASVPPQFGNAPPALSFERVGLTEAGRRFDACAEPGQRIAVVGASGAGKTTLLNLAAGLDRPARGRVRIDGIAPTDLPLAQRRRMFAHVGPQSPILAGSLRRALSLGLAPRPCDERLLAVARDFGLGGTIARLGGLDGRVAENGRDLSSGERSRLLLARATLAAPRLLLIDASEGLLDPAGRHALRRLLRNIGATVLLVTQDERLAREMDAIWFMHSGRVVAAGPPAAVLDGEGAGAGFFAQREAA